MLFLSHFRNLATAYFLILLCCGTGCSAKPRSFNEGFEKGKKDAYTAAPVTLESGIWLLNDALIANSDKDKKNGKSCLRIKNNGSVSMAFDVSGEIKQLSISHATYANDAAAEWSLQYSTNKGAEWKNTGEVVYSTGILNTTIFNIGQKGSIRFRIQKLNGGRLNIDDITTGAEAVATVSNTFKASRDNNMALGNPSKADDRNEENLLVVKPQFALSYNNKKGIPNWVSWHLSSAWKGDAERCNCFSPDTTLPKSYFKALTSQYVGKGFDRGHLCPSDDRDGNTVDNAATFLMTNIAPQAPNLNRDVWEKLETYCRQLASEGNELYIIAGCYGIGGAGEKATRNDLGNRISVPARFWKVVVVLPNGNDDIKRINKDTRVIAVDMPNDQTANSYQWHHYRTSVDAIEKATGYDLLSKTPVDIQAIIESRADEGKIR
jgi:endonuclease G